MKAVLTISLMLNSILLIYITTNKYRTERVPIGSGITAPEPSSNSSGGALAQLKYLTHDASPSAEASSPAPSSFTTRMGEAKKDSLHSDEEAVQHLDTYETIRKAFEAFDAVIERYVDPEEEFYLEDKELQEAAKYYFSFTSKEDLEGFPITKRIDQLWKLGKFEEGMKFAKERIKRDNADLIALLIQLEYYHVHYKYAEWAETASRIFSVSQAEHGPMYEGIKAMCLADIRIQKEQMGRLLLEGELPLKKPNRRRGANLYQRAFIAALEVDEL